MKKGKWDRNTYVGTSLTGKTIAIIGFGKVRGGAQLLVVPACMGAWVAGVCAWHHGHTRAAAGIAAGSPCTRPLSAPPRLATHALPMDTSLHLHHLLPLDRSAPRWGAAPRAWA